MFQAEHIQILLGHRIGALDHLLELPHISRPLVAEKALHQPGVNPPDVLAVLPVETGDEAAAQERNVALAAAQGRDV